MTDDFNSYPECNQCGHCCRLTVLALTIEEAERIMDYVGKNHIIVQDKGPSRCPFLEDDGRCIIWPVRSQTCRLFSCQKTRYDVIEENPTLEIPEDKWLVDFRKVFVYHDFVDPR